MREREENKIMKREIEVLVIEPGTAPRVARTENTLEAFGKIIGGPVETGCILPQRVMLFYSGSENAAGCGKGRLDEVAGTFVLCGCEGSEYVSLSPAQRGRFLSYFTRRAKGVSA